MAEVIARDILPSSEFEVISAGSQPSGVVHPKALLYLNKNGFDVKQGSLHSVGFESFEILRPDVYITVCSQANTEACPVFLEDISKVHWPLPDPSQGEALDDIEEEQAFAFVIETLISRINIFNEHLGRENDKSETREEVKVSERIKVLESLDKHFVQLSDKQVEKA